MEKWILPWTKGALYDYRDKKYQGEFYQGQYHGKGTTYHPYCDQDDEEKIHQQGTGRGVFQKERRSIEFFVKPFMKLNIMVSIIMRKRNLIYGYGKILYFRFQECYYSL